MYSINERFTHFYTYEQLALQSKLRWNVLISAIKSGLTAKLNEMDVLNISHEKIEIGDANNNEVRITFIRDEIMQEHKPQILNFKSRFFSDGKELI